MKPLIWITRSRTGADRDARALEAAGHAVLSAPVLRIEPSEAAPPDAGFQWVIFLSEHAVRCVPSLGFCEGARVLAVGSATAAALAHRGVSAAVPDRHSSEGLAELLAVEDVAGSTVLIVAGEEGQKTLRDALRERGAEVSEYLCYRRLPGSVPVEALDSVGTILVASQDGFRQVARLWFDSGGPADVRVIAASPRIAALGEELGFGEVSIAAGAAPADWVAALEQEGRSVMPSEGSEEQGPEKDLETPPQRDGGAASKASEDVERARQADAVSGREDGRPRSRGRVLGTLGLLVGVAGLALAGYLYYLLVYQDPQAVVDARLVNLEARLQDRVRALEALEDAQREAMAEFAEQQRGEREASAERLLEAVNRMASQAPPSRREWKVAEVAYLLRIANHRLLMERDVDGALTLLRSADVILAELDDFALYQVRAELADEILSLENVESNDVQGLFLRLEAIKTEVRRQNLKLPSFADADTATDAPEGFWAALAHQLGGYFRFRRFDGANVKPLLAPEEAAYLELNLRLMLERAQLAALRREQVVYEQSLETAADWIATHLDQEEPSVQRSLEELETLADVQLEAPLPDISGSLSALKSLGEA